MSKCLPCTKVSLDEQGVINYYKKLFESVGKEYYVYRLNTDDGIKIIEKAYFSTVFETQIKPNFINGAEYFFISEFRGG